MRKILFLLTIVFIIFICSDAKAQLIGEGDTLWCKPLHDIQQILYSPDGTKLGVGSGGQIILFNPDNGEELLRINDYRYKFQFSHDSKLIYYVNTVSKLLLGCDVETGEIKEEYSLKYNDILYVGSLNLTKNPDLLIISDGAVFNKRTNTIIEYSGTSGISQRSAFSLNSDYIIGSVTHSDNIGSIYYRNTNYIEDLFLLGKIQGNYYTGRIDVSMSYDGKYAASIIADLVIWDVENKKIFKTYLPFYWSNQWISAFTHKNEMIVVIENPGDGTSAMTITNFKNDKRAVIYPKGIWSFELDIRNDDKSLAFANYIDSLNSLTLTVVKLKTDAVSDVEDNTNDINIISPNPASDFIYLPETNNLIKEATIYSIFGEKVLQFNDFQSNTIDISGLSKGVYFLRINNKSYKFVKI